MKNSKKTNHKQHTGKNRGLLLVTASMIVLCLAVVLVTGRSRKSAEEASAVQSQEKGEAVIVEEGKALLIQADEITAEASFFPIDVDGTRMEVIAVRDGDGNIRTAFNTCQICYSSGRGYYVQQGRALVCQNCGNRFTVEQVGIESGGCNPWPIFEEDRNVTGDSIEISYDFLAASREIFSNWKINY